MRAPKLVSNIKSEGDIWWKANEKSLEYFDTEECKKILTKFIDIFNNDLDEIALELSLRSINASNCLSQDTLYIHLQPFERN